MGNLYPGVGDVNNDGILDVVAGRGLGGGIATALGNGDGTFQSFITSSPGGNFWPSVALADFNEDGHLDIVGTDSNSLLTVQFGDGTGSFGGGTTLATGTGPSWVTAADVNNDGNVDLLSAEQGTGTVSLFLGTGSGTFGTRRSFQMGSSVQNVQVADLNSDGRLDMVGASSSGVTVRLGNGDGTFQGTVTYAISGGSDATVITDLNNDGRLDVVARRNSGGLSTYLNRGNGTFQAGSTYSGNGFISLPSGMAAGDFDGDGNQDIATGSYLGFRANTIYMGQGDGTFADQSTILDFSDFYTSYAKDLDISTVAAARTAMARLDARLTRLSDFGGEVGAIQARLQVSYNTLSASKLNYEAAASRITDADIAENSAALLASRIRQQTAAQVLGQVNLQPQIALTLLRAS